MPVGPFSTFAACLVGTKAQYRKSHPDWTEEHLTEVCSAVCGQMEKQTRQGKWEGDLHVTYQAAFEPFDKDEKHFVKVFNLKDDFNRNGWGVTAEARARSLGTFFKNRLLGPKELSDERVIDADPSHPHYGEYAIIGKPVDVINNGATYGVFEVTVPKAWEMIQSGELSAVSPSIHIREAQFTDEGKELITAFDWDHTLFVPVGAIPEARVVDTCKASDVSMCNFRQAVQAAFHGQDSSESRQDGAGYSPMAGNPTDNKPEENPLGVKTLSDDKTEQGCKEAQAKLEQRLKALEDKTAQAQSTAPQDKPNLEQIAQAQKLKDLEAKLQARDEADLSIAALGVVDLEVQAALIKADKRTERIAELKKLGAPALAEMQARYKQLVEKVQAAKEPREAHRLKADFDEAIRDPAQANSITEQIRQASFGIVRSPEDVAKLEKTLSWVK